MKNVTPKFDATKNMLLPIAISDTVQESVRRFCENQEKILGSMENFANGWFMRRHAGTRAALEAAQSIWAAQNPVDLVHAYQDWMNGAFNRLMTDVVAFAAVGPFAEVRAPLDSKQEPEKVQPEAKPFTRSKAA